MVFEMTPRTTSRPANQPGLCCRPLVKRENENTNQFFNHFTRRPILSIPNRYLIERIITPESGRDQDHKNHDDDKAQLCFGHAGEQLSKKLTLLVPPPLVLCGRNF